MDILKPEVETAIEEGARGIGNGSTAECEGGSMTRESIVAIRMWRGGPLRQMAATKASNAFIPFAKSINGCHFAGRYVCDECQEPCTGVSLSDVGKMSGNRQSGWLCDLCIRGKERKVLTQVQKQALIDRLAAARRDRTTTVRIQRSEEMMPEICNVAAVTADVNPLKEVYGTM
jgi:hypothetical protein